ERLYTSLPRRGSANCATCARDVILGYVCALGLERATRFELATASLEDWSSTTELRPRVPFDPVLFGGQAKIRTLEADGNRFTVCPLCPLGYLPNKPPVLSVIGT